MPLRVLGDDGSGYVSDAITAYTYAARNGARVVNASLGGPSFSRAEHDALAAAPNTLFVVAAGNDGADNDTTPEYPCDYDLANVVCVAASGHDDALASFSNYGPANVDLAAPGVDIASTWPGGRYALLDGTSMATPHVAGAAALLLAHDGTLTVAGLRAALLSSAEPVAALARRVASGGRLDVAAALSVPPAPPAPPPARRRPAHPPSPCRPRRRQRPTARRPASRCASIAGRCTPSASAACASLSARRRPVARASTSASTRAALVACTCPRARSGARAPASARPDARPSPCASRRAWHAPCARPRACASSPTRWRSTPPATAAAPSAPRRSSAERSGAGGRAPPRWPSRPAPRAAGAALLAAAAAARPCSLTTRRSLRCRWR